MAGPYEISITGLVGRGWYEGSEALPAGFIGGFQETKRRLSQSPSWVVGHCDLQKMRRTTRPFLCPAVTAARTPSLSQDPLLRGTSITWAQECNPALCLQHFQDCNMAQTHGGHVPAELLIC